MTTASILALARKLYYTSTEQMTDNELLEYMNNVYHDLENDIVTYVNEDYYWLSKFQDSVEFKNSYALPATGTSVPNGFKKLKNVYLRYDTSDYTAQNTMTVLAGSATITYTFPSTPDVYPGDLIEVTDDNAVTQTKYVTGVSVSGSTITVDSVFANAVTAKNFTVKRGEYIKLKLNNSQSELMDYMRYNEDQSLPYSNQMYLVNTTNGVYRIVGNNIEVYPRTRKSLKYGLKIEYIADNVDLALLGTESDINIPWQYQNMIAVGMGRWIYQAKGMLNEATNAMNIFNTKKQEMLSELQDRDNSTPLVFTPSLTNLE